MTFSNPRYKGRPVKPFSERKVQVHAYVKRKYAVKVQRIIDKLVKEYR
jgi:hypothetical protein